MKEEEKLTGLPENAFRPLKPGETYEPIMSPKSLVRPLGYRHGYLIFCRRCLFGIKSRTSF